MTYENTFLDIRIMPDGFDDFSDIEYKYFTNLKSFQSIKSTYFKLENGEYYEE